MTHGGDQFFGCCGVHESEPHELGCKFGAPTPAEQGYRTPDLQPVTTGPASHASADARLDRMIERAERGAQPCLDCEVGEPHVCPRLPAEQATPDVTLTEDERVAISYAAARVWGVYAVRGVNDLSSVRNAVELAVEAILAARLAAEADARDERAAGWDRAHTTMCSKIPCRDHRNPYIRSRADGGEHDAD